MDKSDGKGRFKKHEQSKQLMEQVILLSVNSYENKTIAGRIWYGCLGKGQSFSSLMELLRLIEAHLEELDTQPESKTCRSFLNSQLVESHLQEIPSISRDYCCEALAVFQLKILFRQNSQGLLLGGRQTRAIIPQCFGAYPSFG